MNRSHISLAVLLLACAAFAAPVPKPFVSGWSKFVDPSGDCKISRGNGALIIEMPGSDHDYDPARDRVNAPRILRDFEGDFDMQLRVRIDSRPSDQSTVEEQPSYVAGGFIVIPPETFDVIFIRLQFREEGKGIGAAGYTTDLSRDVKGGFGYGVYNKGWKLWPFQARPEYVYLRLDRRGDILGYKISPDGRSWVSVGGGQIIGLPSKLKVGLAAFSTSSKPSKVRFDQLKLTRNKKKSK